MTTSGDAASPDQFTVGIPIKAGDVIGLDNANSALIFKTGVLGEFPELWTPPLPDGGSSSAPTPPAGTTTNGYELQIDAYVQPSPTTSTTTTTTTSTPSTTTVTTTTVATTTTTSTPAPAGHTPLKVANVLLKASWRHSRLTAKVQFSVSLRGASRLTAVIREAAAVRSEPSGTTSPDGQGRLSRR